MGNISSRVQQIIDSCNNDYLDLITGKDQIQPLRYNQRETLRRINFYLNSRYLERNDDALFWNLSNYRITHFAKNIDLDTKDFMPYGNGDVNFFQSWALRKKVRKWFDNTAFYMSLNELSEGLATYGSQIWKKTKVDGKIIFESPKLENVYFDQSAKSISDVDGIVEIHYLSANDLWGKSDVWENTAEVIKKNKDNNQIQVWEFTGWVSENDEQPEFHHCIGYGYGEDYTKLWSDEKATPKERLYYDFHIGSYRGCWLRAGVVERLFKVQERANQLVNQNAQATEIASLLLFKSGVGDYSGNVLEQAVNGQIIGDPEFQQVGIDNRGLQQFISEMQAIEVQADKLCLTPDIIQGEQAPSNTTFRAIAVINSAAKSAFSIYKQNLGEKVANILMTDVFPSTVKDWNRESVIEIAEDEQDVAMYDNAMRQTMIKEAMLSGNLITPDLVAEIDKKIEDGIKLIGRRINVGEKFFNFEWGFKIMATNESVDKQVMNDAYFNALQMVQSNPAITNIPLFRQYLENNGISWWKLTAKEQQLLTEAINNKMPEQKKPDALLTMAQAQ